MRTNVRTVGEVVSLECMDARAASILARAIDVETGAADGEDETLRVRIDPGSRAFDVAGWEPVRRGAWRKGSAAVIADVSGSGFDMRVTLDEAAPSFFLRRRLSSSERAASLLLRARFHLLARAALLHYPAMWRAGLRGRVPLHASVLTTRAGVALIAGPGGLGKSTLLAAETRAGAKATSDNICVSDGITAWGLAEPLRLAGVRGQRMPHGRGETQFIGRVASLDPVIVVTLRRGFDGGASIRRCSRDEAMRALVGGTYSAEELRRYWAFAATLALASGLGVAHPRVEDVAAELVRRATCVEITLGAKPGARLSELLAMVEAGACA